MWKLHYVMVGSRIDHRLSSSLPFFFFLCDQIHAKKINYLSNKTLSYRHNLNQNHADNHSVISRSHNHHPFSHIPLFPFLHITILALRLLTTLLHTHCCHSRTFVGSISCPLTHHIVAHHSSTLSPKGICCCGRHHLHISAISCCT